MKNIFDEYKEKICTYCVHYGDKEFQDCEIRECVNYKTEDKCKTRAKCFYYKKDRNKIKFNYSKEEI